MLTTDLIRTTPLKVVERHRVDTILDEIGIRDMTDPRVAVRVGALSGAQSFLFGYVLVLEETVRVDLHWVDTSTSEHILPGTQVEGKFRKGGDLLEMEKRILADLLPQIRVLLGDEEGVWANDRVQAILDERKKCLPDERTYLDLVLKAGEAILAEQGEDVDAAIDAWTEARDLDPGRAASLAAFQSLATSDAATRTGGLASMQ